MEQAESIKIKKLAENSIDFHSHGVGSFDFTEIAQLDLNEIENILAKRNHQTILTLYLPKPNFDQFLSLMESFDSQKKSGKLSHILGISIEGPLLASHGGTPEEGVWMPTKQHWKQIAACGRKGLLYVVLSPDASIWNNQNLQDANGKTDVTWIAETLLEGGVLPAPGHFMKNDPSMTAQALQTLFDVVAAWGHGPTVTDHLFNDMPRNFKHAWRTLIEKEQRDEQLRNLNIDSWTLETLEENLGIVPAIMIRNAHKGLVKICQNFDGEHVDLAIVKKAVSLIGAENMIMMTDSIESKRLAGRQLYMKENSTLLYQDQGVVAAGSQNVSHQIQNMLSIGLDVNQIKLITHTVPSQIIDQQKKYLAECAHAKTHCI